MRLKLMLFSLPFLIGFLSCQDNSPEGKVLNKLYDNVMEVHDDVMPKISDMNRLGRQLKKQDPEKADPEVQSAIRRLDQEEDRMMNWMRDFKRPSYDDVEKAKAYLAEEQKRIEVVRAGMLESMKIAKSLVK